MQPSDTWVETDLGTACRYTGDANGAIAQFIKVLAIAPTKPDTLFNLGIVKWQGKKDAPGAIAAWQKLLDANPNYENREKVLRLIAQAEIIEAWRLRVIRMVPLKCSRKTWVYE
jgi:tetratricopeptide (TPR) repeat protein